MTLGQLRARLRQRLMEMDETGRFPNAELNNFINDSLREVARRFRVLSARQDVALAANQDRTPVPPTAFRVYRVTIAGTVLEPTSVEALDVLYRGVGGWEALPAGTPTRWFLDGTDIVVVPKPDAATTITVWYNTLPQELVNDADESPLPEALEELVVLGAYYRALLADNDGRATAAFQEYEARAQRAERDWFGVRPQPRTRLRLEASGQ